LPLPHTAIVRGDGRCLSIAAASVIAKVTRDRIMDEADAIYPHYGFARHKGYATPEHLAALRQHGPTPIHRFSFSPVAQPELLCRPAATIDSRAGICFKEADHFLTSNFRRASKDRANSERNRQKTTSHCMNKALLIGINHYKIPGADLRGCVNDVNNLKAALLKYFAFQEQNIKVFTDLKATKKAMQDGMMKLVKGAKRGDVLLIHYSGHGSN